MSNATIDELWSMVAGNTVGDHLVEWPPDLLAFTDAVLERSEAYRFVVSPPAGHSWPPLETADWSAAVGAAASSWCEWTEAMGADLPPLVERAWKVVRDGGATSIEDIAEGQAWEVCEALITLHAVADEACAGMGVSIASGRTSGHRARARARELLARTGSLSRIPTDRLRVLPKVRTSDGGISFRSLSRYATVRGPAVDVVWHRAPARRPGTAQQHANILLLPWPLRIRERDFRALPQSVKREEKEPFGFFEFAPSAPFDFDLLDRVLTAAADEASHVDAVILPEAAVTEADLDPIEETLARHGVTMVVAGVRERAGGPGDRLPSNWVHTGVFLGGRWWRYRQNKHHRWFLDASQIEQYHLGGALHPAVRWWEAMEVPRRSMQFLELGEGITLVPVICEDLARLDEVSDLLRAVGPTLVATILLDGPQLTSRWTARYASVFADDPGSAVLTLTAFGFSDRSRPGGRPASPVIALWKDASRGFREIALESGAQGVLLTASVGRTRRRTADGRMPIDDAADLVVASIHQVRAGERGTASAAGTSRPDVTGAATGDLTVLASWSEAVAEAAISGADVEEVVRDACPGAPWRAALGLSEPSTALAAALAALRPPSDLTVPPTPTAMSDLAVTLLSSALDVYDT